MFTWHITWCVTDTMLNWYLSIAWFAFCLPQNASVVFRLYHFNIFPIFSINSLLCLFAVAPTSAIQSAPTCEVKWLSLDDFITKSTCTQICLSDILRFGTLFQIYSHQDFNCLSQIKWQYFQSIPIDIRFSSSHKSHSEVHVKADFCSLKHLGCFLRTLSSIINLD